MVHLHYMYIHINEFYARFDKYDFSQEQEKLHSELILKAKDCDHMEITKESVVKCMGMIKPNKACGPDNIGGRVLKECKLEFAPVLQLRALPKITGLAQTACYMEIFPHHTCTKETTTQSEQ